MNKPDLVPLQICISFVWRVRTNRKCVYLPQYASCCPTKYKTLVVFWVLLPWYEEKLWNCSTCRQQRPEEDAESLGNGVKQSRCRCLRRTEQTGNRTDTTTVSISFTEMTSWVCSRLMCGSVFLFPLVISPTCYPPLFMRVVLWCHFAAQATCARRFSLGCDGCSGIKSHVSEIILDCLLLLMLDDNPNIDQERTVKHQRSRPLALVQCALWSQFAADSSLSLDLFFLLFPFCNNVWLAALNQDVRLRRRAEGTKTNITAQF